MAEPNITGVQSSNGKKVEGKVTLNKPKGVAKFKASLSSAKDKLDFSAKISIANKLSDIAGGQQSIENNKNIEGRLFGSKLNNIDINSVKTISKTNPNDPLLYGELNTNVTIDFTLRVVCKNQCNNEKFRYLPNNISLTFDMKVPLREGPYDNVPGIGALKRFVVVKMTPMASAVTDAGARIDQFVKVYSDKYGVSVATGMCRISGNSVCR